MKANIIILSVVSLLLTAGTIYLINSDKSELQDFKGNLTPSEHMLCRAKQYAGNDYKNCIMNYLDYACQSNYFNWLSQYRQDETKFYEIYLEQPNDVKQVAEGWNSSCNTFEHYRRCGAAEKVFTHCVYGKLYPQCSIENQEYIEAAYACGNVPESVPRQQQFLVEAQCIQTIVHLAKGQLAEALACQ